MIYWKWMKFDELSVRDLYQVLQARQAVFGIEQNCIYQDADDLDQHSLHLVVREQHKTTGPVIGYLRVVYPSFKYPEPSIGRVLVVAGARGRGLGKQLMRRGVDKIVQEFPTQSIRISAQQYLQRFYEDFGFEQVAAPYIEDGIPHVEMLCKRS